MDLKHFFDRAIELREEYAESNPHCLLVLTEIVHHVFKNGGFQQSITIEHPIYGRFYDFISHEDFQKVINDLGINFRLVSYGEKPTCTQRTGRACLAKTDD